jgi:hypothetical protein
MSIVPAAMVEPHRVVRGSCQTIVIPALNLFFCRFFYRWKTITMANPL